MVIEVDTLKYEADVIRSMKRAKTWGYPPGASHAGDLAPGLDTCKQKARLQLIISTSADLVPVRPIQGPYDGYEVGLIFPIPTAQEMIDVTES